jgi:iron complex transport system substrate-binding protein
VTRRLLLVLLLATPFLAACGECEEPLGELSQPYPVTVQGAGEQQTLLRKEPSRIVALDAGPARVLSSLGAGHRIVGAPTGMRVSRQARPVVDRSGQVNVPAIVRLRPDLIVASPSVDPLDVSRAQRNSGAALYVQPDESVDDLVQGVLDLGVLVGEPVRARRVANHMRRQVEAVEKRVAGEPLASVFVDTGFFITIPARSLFGDLIRRARGESIAGEVPGPEPFPVQQLRRADPDVYMTTSESRLTLEDLQRDPRTKSLTAVEEGRVVSVPAELVRAPGPAVGRALARVARALHPDAFG